jgi:hypothetical protein
MNLVAVARFGNYLPPSSAGAVRSVSRGVSLDDLPQSGEVANAKLCYRGSLHLLRLAERLACRHMLALRIVQTGWMFT